LWQEEELEQIFSRESLTGKAAEIEKMISVKEHKRERHDFDPTMFYENRFWTRKPDGFLICKNHQALYILEFKRPSDRNEDFLGVKEDEANEQHQSTHTFEHIELPAKLLDYFLRSNRSNIDHSSSMCSKRLPRNGHLNR